jgi:hypothetical protein
MEDKDRDTINGIWYMVWVIYLVVFLGGCWSCNKQDEIKQQLNNIEYKINH